MGGGGGIGSGNGGDVGGGRRHCTGTKYERERQYVQVRAGVRGRSVLVVQQGGGAPFRLEVSRRPVKAEPPEGGG
jgi:hypothetical protein